MPTPSQPKPTTPLGAPTPGSAPVQPPSLRRQLPASYPPGFRPINKIGAERLLGLQRQAAQLSRTGRSATITYSPGGQKSAEAPAPRASSHEKLLAEVKRHNAMVRNSEQMFAIVKRFKDLCNTGVIVSKTTQAECDRIIAMVEGGAA